ncbi:putative beta-glucan synthesis-associated protein [Zancudomyces culisetae]|uniref:Putative beta-glucan synthesis-associated protein n=1 Tax=Zancudomyces culisetae TaxID=1213189 RepID=A0A1R1PPD8_ZANCU|nr:putative beta-glucan synthesis-associated protein [Zancudomyces culisetae]|eukprot:OMH82810.1 putative beta-glucan synthesis-associated protein [Zancudomyces culisetae]
MAQKLSSLGQPLVPNPLPIDPDTPADVRRWNSRNNETYTLVFSDEFNKDGRTFEPGKDKIWEAQDLHYWQTKDYEYYSPPQAATRDGSLVLTLEKKPTKDGFEYVSGMINSWNKFCFQGGYIETRVSFPGDGKVSGYWPAVWTLGNLGRAGFGATTDGLWPYTYNSCDQGVLPNQVNRDLSSLPGQRLSACVCNGNHPSPGIGRGAPEIDIIEGSVDVGGLPNVSMSYQMAPFDEGYRIKESAYRIFNYGTEKPGETRMNLYIGDKSQQCASAIHFLDSEVSGGRKFQTFGFEYTPGENGFIRWYSNGQPVWEINSSAIGPNEFSKVSQRLISEEPMVSSAYIYIYLFIASLSTNPE